MRLFFGAVLLFSALFGADSGSLKDDSEPYTSSPGFTQRNTVTLEYLTGIAGLLMEGRGGIAFGYERVYTPWLAGWRHYSMNFLVCTHQHRIGQDMPDHCGFYRGFIRMSGECKYDIQSIDFMKEAVAADGRTRPFASGMPPMDPGYYWCGRIQSIRIVDNENQALRFLRNPTPFER